MDEIDSIGSSRIESGSGGDSEVQRTMLELLNQLDGFEATKNIKVSSVYQLRLVGGIEFFCWCADCLNPCRSVDCPSFLSSHVGDYGYESYRHIGPRSIATRSH